MARRWNLVNGDPKMRKTYPVATNIELKAIVDRCLDRRFRVAHRRFIEEELGLAPENIVPIKRAGGAGPLGRKKRGWKRIPKDLRKQVELFVEHYPEIELIVLINHEDCRRFDKLRNAGKRNCEIRHLKKAVRIFCKEFPDKKVVGYFGRFVDESRQEIYFELVAGS
jgi:hypothetical protein